MPGAYPWVNTKVLYIGSLDNHSNSYRRYKTLQQLGLDVYAVDIDKYIYQTVFSSFHHRLNIGPGILKLNRELKTAIKKFAPGLIWVDNKPFVTAKLIKSNRRNFPNTKWINLVTDDPTGRYKKAWRIFKATAPLYDLHFVQRIENIKEVMAYGAQKVALCFRSFDPEFHRPMHITETEHGQFKTGVGFIGTYEQERENSIAVLISNGIAVQVTGDGWSKGKHWELIKPYYTGPSVYGEEYINRLNGMDIALHFLRHANRDGQDSRTFEIPACKVFMLAERSELHQQFFSEDEEAVFFGNDEELLSKVKYYLTNPALREQIAAAGYARSMQSGYSHKERLTDVLNKIFES